MNKLEELLIYKQCFELICYTESIVVKFPKCEKFSLVTTIKNTTYGVMREIIIAQREYDKKARLKVLNALDVELKMLKVLIRLSYRKKYISPKNYAAWSKKIANISFLLGGWIKSCLKQ